ncbi:hypothetical protein TVAG_439200 [Trichomonas vaginalis G3]|uniref:Uncharacterized protein n=1 Tax=Trichomonas vaginalis (strain ATCC PRA-98 / G3) TaxID=412133 RepID=A2FQY7_TRIV3|nr:hypothetical protein TVAGG3_0236100 [Trichomonas vaginalis G3]EAX92692.1 hypothetical protein TVAG_439200 [Trichomonas vaginalis G3]KAI5553005.1 hypothetical protein TVAGG3_0236100 [Trichomonas vaginalis G3]|eukprot:XP_001305622.1 hypothetical protein [Trichomonas vaginalis G3]
MSSRNKKREDLLERLKILKNKLHAEHLNWVSPNNKIEKFEPVEIKPSKMPSNTKASTESLRKKWREILVDQKIQKIQDYRTKDEFLSLWKYIKGYQVNEPPNLDNIFYINNEDFIKAQSYAIHELIETDI